MLEFKSGQILIFNKNPISILDYKIAKTQADTTKTHVAMVGLNPNMIWTTNANTKFTSKYPFVRFEYGKKNIYEYIKGRTFDVAEFVEPLTHNELLRIENLHNGWKGQNYGFDVLNKLIMKSYYAGFVSQVHYPAEKPTEVKNPICSEAVTACAWLVGRDLCKDLGKLEPAAVTPENIHVASLYGDVIKSVAREVKL